MGEVGVEVFADLPDEADVGLLTHEVAAGAKRWRKAMAWSQGLVRERCIRRGGGV